MVNKVVLDKKAFKNIFSIKFDYLFYKFLSDGMRNLDLANYAPAVPWIDCVVLTD